MTSTSYNSVGALTLGALGALGALALGVLLRGPRVVRCGGSRPIRPHHAAWRGQCRLPISITSVSTWPRASETSCGSSSTSLRLKYRDIAIRSDMSRSRKC